VTECHREDLRLRLVEVPDEAPAGDLARVLADQRGWLGVGGRRARRS
jgi:hypothetical protein